MIYRKYSSGIIKLLEEHLLKFLTLILNLIKKMMFLYSLFLKLFSEIGGSLYFKLYFIF